MLLRYAALAALVVAASGCVEERVVHDRRPVQREYVEVVAPQPPPVQVIEVEPEGRPGYRYVHPHWEQRNDGYHWQGGGWVR